ncbi:MAG: HU family DNA-binding protein [Rhodobacteraceae bacterium]|nr:HU family DNA-binding protein [Paracoccaceae bacterium]
MARATKKKTTTRKSAPKTAAKATTTAKSATAAPKRKAPAKTAPATAASKGVTTPAKPVSITRELKKKELIDRVAVASGLKKPQARAAIEATLAILGEALEKGEAMNLEPLGKVKVQKEKDAGAAKVYSCRVRRKKASAEPAKAPLAEAAE